MLIPIKLKKIPSPLLLNIWSRGTIRAKLKYLISTNKLYVTDDTKSIADENGLRHTVIAKSVSVKYKKFKNEYNDKLIKITFFKLSQLETDKKLTQLEQQLESLLNAQFIKTEISNTNVTYILKLKDAKDSYKHILKYADFEKSSPETIKLSKYHTWNLNDNFASLGIFGSSGSGKSRLAYYIINNAMKLTNHKNIFIVDPKNDELAIYSKNIFNLKNVSTDFDTTLKFTKSVHELMEKRFNKRQQKMSAIHFNHVFLIIDELAALKLDTDKKSYTEFEAIIKKLALKGRAANIHLILLCQRPSTESIPADIRDQLKIRILLGDVSNADTFKMAMGETKDVDNLQSKTAGNGYIKFEGKPIENYSAPLIYTPNEQH